MKAVIGALSLAHEDKRRVISEFNPEGGNFSVQDFMVFEQIPLGNHFHERKTETFIITGGGGTLILQEVDDTGNLMGEPESHSVQTGCVIQIPPRTAHTFLLVPQSTMVCLSSAPFNPEDKDMIPAKLV